MVSDLLLRFPFGLACFIPHRGRALRHAAQAVRRGFHRHHPQPSAVVMAFPIGAPSKSVRGVRMENNAIERAPRPIAVGRNAWLLFGSGDHAQAAANIFSLIASCVLHGLDAESYLPDIIRVLPYWPRDRYLELAPKYWTRTRASLDQAKLKRPIGHVTAPPLAAEQQPSTD